MNDPYTCTTHKRGQKFQREAVLRDRLAVQQRLEGPPRQRGAENTALGQLRRQVEGQVGMS